MAIVLYDNIKIGTGKPSEPKYLNTSNQPYTDTAQVISQVPVGERHIGLTVNINKSDYWFKEGTANSDLVLKSNGSSSGNGWKVSGTTFLSDTGATINFDDKQLIFSNVDNSFQSAFRVDSLSNIFLDRKTFEIGAMDITTKYSNDSSIIEQKIDSNGLTSSFKSIADSDIGTTRLQTQNFDSLSVKDSSIEHNQTLNTDGYYLTVGTGGTVNSRISVLENEMTFAHKNLSSFSLNDFGVTIQSPLSLTPATATRGQLRLQPSTTNVTTVNNGDIWFSNDHLYLYTTGGTQQLDRQGWRLSGTTQLVGNPIIRGTGANYSGINYENMQNVNFVLTGISANYFMNLFDASFAKEAQIYYFPDYSQFLFNDNLTPANNTSFKVGSSTGLEYYFGSKRFGISTSGEWTINIGSDAEGDIYYRQANNFKRLARGTTDQVLGITGNYPAWKSLTANNGITKSPGNNFRLGGALTGTTTLTSASGSRLNFAGYPVQYSADLSGSYNIRSLVDRGYVTGLTSTLLLQSFNRRTTNYTLVLADKDRLVESNIATGNTVTIPPNSSVAFSIGTVVNFTQYNVGQTTIVAGAGVTIRSASNKYKLNVQYSFASAIKIGTDEWYLTGDLTS